jgi:hypothetical protein
MDRAMIERHLVQAEGHVTLGRQHLARQVEIVADLKRGGHVAVAESASEILQTLQESQMQHEAHRDRLLKELQEGE